MNNPRIIAGKYKGRKLIVPNTARPITDRMKQSMFDTIQDHIANATVLDLYAGSGSIGIEALSRGAQFVTFVEKNIHAIQKNCESLQISQDQFEIKEETVEKFIENPSKTYDLIFIDPPYTSLTDFSISKILSIFTTDTIGVLKFPTKEDIHEERIDILYSAEFGSNKLIYYKRKNL